MKTHNGLYWQEKADTLEGMIEKKSALSKWLLTSSGLLLVVVFLLVFDRFHCAFEIANTFL